LHGAVSLLAVGFIVVLQLTKEPRQQSCLSLVTTVSLGDDWHEYFDEDDMMNQDEFAVASAILEDGRKVIAAGKNQRWDVVKWGVTVNIALTTASLALFEDHPSAAGWLFCLAVIVALIGEGLVLHFNNRLKNARNDTVVPEQYLIQNGIDISAITGKEPTTVDWLYDKEELGLFTITLIATAVPTFLIFLFGKYSFG
jgi:hypothetical protein